MPILQVAFQYNAHAPVRNRPSGRSATIWGSVPVAFAEVDAASCPLAARVEGAGHGRRRDLSPALETAVVHAYAGGFVTAYDPEPDAVDASGLPLLAPPPGHSGSWGRETGLFARFGSAPIRAEELRWRGDVRTDEDRMRAEAVAKASAMCVLDGRLMVPCPEPVLSVRRYRFGDVDRIEVVPTLVRMHCVSDERTFSLGDGESALAFAEALGRRLGIPVERFGSFEATAGIAFPHDGLLDYGSALFAQHRADFASHRWTETPELAGSPAFAEAVAALRGAVPGAAEGSPASVRDAFEALGAMVDAFPAGASTGIPRLDEMMTDRFGAALLAYRMFDADRALDIDADALAIPAYPGGF
jgi:hypothetical protein